MSGKGAKGLITGKTTINNKDKDKKKPVSRSSRAGLQVSLSFSFFIPWVENSYSVYYKQLLFDGISVNNFKFFR